MTATLIDALRVLYPDAVPGIDYQIDANDREQIAEWYLDAKRPGAQKIATAKTRFVVGQAAAAKQAQLIKACRSAIISGYQSSALGTPHLYPSAPEDQLNMLASVAESQGPDVPADWTTAFACVPPDQAANPVWPWEMHSAEQIQQAGSDGKAWVTAQRIQLRTLLAELAAIDPKAADALAQIDAVVWSNGAP